MHSSIYDYMFMIVCQVIKPFIKSHTVDAIAVDSKEDDTTGVSEGQKENVLQNRYVENVTEEDKLYMLLAMESKYNLKPKPVIQTVCREIGYE